MLTALLPFVLTTHTFGWKGDQFLLDGKPFQIRSGDMHYVRVPRPYWRDRFRKMRAMGLNTLTTYIFWNAHETEPGKFDFSGNLDIREYVKEAQEEGLYVLLRPGPYVCSEWEWGGFPYWLANIPGIKIRQNEPKFLAASKRYLDAVGKQLAPLTVSHGGPIIMCQVENEYGSFGNDHEYMAAIRDQIKGAGFDCQLYTSDGPGQGMLNGGTLPDALSVVNFGGGAPDAFKEFAKFRPAAPRMCGEYWAGWFDHWGAEHARTSGDEQVKDLDWMMDKGVSFNVYMIHGGTTNGWMNGANSGGTGYEPDVSSYDYDSAIAEDGRLTPKWFTFRKAIAAHTGGKLPETPADLARIAIPRFPLTERLGVMPSVRIETGAPVPFEALHHPYGFVLYRTKLTTGGKGRLVLNGLQDRAIVSVNGKSVGVIERMRKQDSLEIEAPDGAVLDVLVENQGRVNFSRKLLDERKGFVSASFNGSPLAAWSSTPIELDPNTKRRSNEPGPAMIFGHFNLSRVGDTYLDMRGWNKGNVWVNGHHIGRYWSIGAQQSQFVPGCWLKKGRNDVAILELNPDHQFSLEGVADPIYEVKR